MPDLPTWLTNVLLQFPIVVIIGYAVWVAYNRLERREERQEKLLVDRTRRLEEHYDKLRQEVREDKLAEIERTDRRHREEIALVTEQFTGELKKLTKEVDQLSRKPRT